MNTPMDEQEAAAAVLDELIRRFDATIPTPMNRRGESMMRIEHFVDLSHEAKKALALLRRDAPREGAGVEDRAAQEPTVLPNDPRWLLESIAQYGSDTLAERTSDRMFYVVAVREMARRARLALEAMDTPDRAPREGGEAGAFYICPMCHGPGVVTLETLKAHRPQPAEETVEADLLCDDCGTAVVVTCPKCEPPPTDAPERDAMTPNEARELLRELRDDFNPEGDDHGRRLALALDFAIEATANRKAPPSDAVGALVGKWRAETAAMEDFGARYTVHRLTDELAAALASRPGVDDAMVVRALTAPYKDGDVSDMLRGGGDEETAIIRDALTAAPSAVAPAGEGVAVELSGVAEVLAEGDGVWRPCSGCCESNDGSYSAWPFSTTLGCHLGHGCHECGGIGAVWLDVSDADDMAREILAPPAVAPVCPYVVSSREGTSYCSLNGPAAQSAGMVPVPREPTEAMLQAAYSAQHDYLMKLAEHCDGGSAPDLCVMTYRAMLAAAPTKEKDHD